MTIIILTFLFSSSSSKIWTSPLSSQLSSRGECSAVMEENKKEWPKANGKNSIEIVLISPLALSLGFGCCYYTRYS